MTTLALTDRDTFAGTVRFAIAAAAAGIRPVIEPPVRITLLAQNAAGWARLCRLVSAAHAEADGAAPVVSWPVLRAYADQDLVVLLGPSSEPVRALSEVDPREWTPGFMRRVTEYVT
jgi:error-prone DNA polymerase